MPFSTQQTNATSRLLIALEKLRDAYWACQEAQSRATLIGIPPAIDFPAPGDLDHLARGRLVDAHAVVGALVTWMNTNNATTSNKKPLDVIVESLR